MLPKIKMIVPAKFSGTYFADINWFIIAMHNRRSSIVKNRVTPKTNFSVRIIFFNFFNNCYDGCDVTARPPADCKNFHSESPLILMNLDALCNQTAERLSLARQQ